VQIIRDRASLRNAVKDLRASGQRVALVPTMGALHAGHMALVEEAKRQAEAVVVSIFVNPTQFGPNEDLAAYPREEARDAEMLRAADVALLWAPGVGEMYPEGFATTVTVSGVSEGLDGVARPGHFAGVATVVAKLFAQVQPDVALFGEKDYQQLAVIRRMTADLDLPLKIIGVPTQRAEDGLALSSRNSYLSPDERRRAVALPRAMQEAVQAMAHGGDVSMALGQVRAELTAAGFGPIDYIALCDAASLAPVQTVKGPARLLVAARLGTTRLIDNIAVAPADA
jgi:pantoate--beta-alanine ligase